MSVNCFFETRMDKIHLFNAGGNLFLINHLLGLICRLDDSLVQIEKILIDIFIYLIIRPLSEALDHIFRQIIYKIRINHEAVQKGCSTKNVTIKQSYRPPIQQTVKTAGVSSARCIRGLTSKCAPKPGSGNFLQPNQRT